MHKKCSWKLRKFPVMSNRFKPTAANGFVFRVWTFGLCKGLFTWYQNEFHSGMNFVPEWSSFRIHMTKSTGSAILKTTVLSSILKTIRMRHSPQTTRFAFSSRNGVRFQFYMIPEWNIIPEREFHSDWKPEWTHSGMTCAGTKFRLGIM